MRNTQLFMKTLKHFLCAQTYHMRIQEEKQTGYRFEFIRTYCILSNKPAAGLIFQSRNYGRVYWKDGFIREAGLLFQHGQRGGAIIFSTFISWFCSGKFSVLPHKSLKTFLT